MKINEKMTSQEFSELQKSVANAGTQLFTVAAKLSEVERSLDNTSINEIDEICVTGLLASMNEVKKEYQSLRKDIQEVQELQKDVTSSIRYQMRTMHQTFKMLKQRLDSAAKRN